MDYDISQPIPQGSNGAQDAENSRIAAIADELERLCAIHEAQCGDSLKDVSRFETEPADKHKERIGLEQSHLFKTTLKDIDAYIIVWEFDSGEYILHSISDSQNILNFLKRK